MILKRVLVKSVHGAFGYVMEHYYPFGMADEASEQGTLTDTYAVISIQDSHTQGFGVQFTENQFCKGVLTLYFDDIVKEVDGAVLFDDDMADHRVYRKAQKDCRYTACPLLCRTIPFQSSWYVCR